MKNADTPINESRRKELETKLEKCRNQQNNPNSSQYRANYSEWDDDDLPILQPMDQDDLENLGVDRIRSPSAY